MVPMCKTSDILFFLIVEKVPQSVHMLISISPFENKPSKKNYQLQKQTVVKKGTKFLPRGHLPFQRRRNYLFRGIIEKKTFSFFEISSNPSETYR